MSKIEKMTLSKYFPYFALLAVFQGWGLNLRLYPLGLYPWEINALLKPLFVRVFKLPLFFDTLINKR